MANITGLRIGIVHPQLYPQTMSGEGPLVETVAALAAETSLSVVELGHVRDELTRARLKVLLASSGLRVAFNAGPEIMRHGWDLNAEDGAARAEALAGLRGQMEEAHFLGARLFTVMSGPDVASGSAPAQHSSTPAPKAMPPWRVARA